MVVKYGKAAFGKGHQPNYWKQGHPFDWKARKNAMKGNGFVVDRGQEVLLDGVPGRRKAHILQPKVIPVSIFGFNTLGQNVTFFVFSWMLFLFSVCFAPKTKNKLTLEVVLFCFFLVLPNHHTKINSTLTSKQKLEDCFVLFFHFSIFTTEDCEVSRASNFTSLGDFQNLDLQKLSKNKME
jgi:hypothetical protein